MDRARCCLCRVVGFIRRHFSQEKGSCHKIKDQSPPVMAGERGKEQMLCGTNTEAAGKAEVAVMTEALPLIQQTSLAVGWKELKGRKAPREMNQMDVERHTEAKQSTVVT